MTALSPRQSWSTLIRLANERSGYARFKFDYFIYELDSFGSQYLVLDAPCAMGKEGFINYVLYEHDHELTCSYVD